MNMVIQNMINRRSIRSYLPEQINKDTLKLILQAGYTAPNAGNRQQIRVVVCQDAKINDHVGKAHTILITKFNRFGYDAKLEADDFKAPALRSAFHEAPTVLMIFGPKNFYFTDADGYIFAENICLAAKSLNIGSCIVGEVLNAFSDDYGRVLREKWGIPKNYRSTVFITLGYSAERAQPHPPSKRYVAPLWVYGSPNLI